jgi:hypothetical protein
MNAVPNDKGIARRGNKKWREDPDFEGVRPYTLNGSKVRVIQK